ncbi:hypothetical protein KI387_030898, partial [Taxus chinensis]
HIMPESSTSQIGCLDIMYKSIQPTRSVQSIGSTSPTGETLSTVSAGRSVSPKDQYNRKNGNYESVIHLGSGRTHSNRHLGLLSENSLQLAKMVSQSAINYSPKLGDDAKELHMFICSSGSSFSEGKYTLKLQSLINPAAMSEPRQHWEELQLHGDSFTAGKQLSGFQGELAGHVKEDSRFPDLIPTSMPTPITSQLLQEDGHERQDIHSKLPNVALVIKLILTTVCSKLVYNPNSYASLLGILWALISARWDLEMPQIVKGSITILSNAGLGLAMFSLGLFMALQPRIIACGPYLAIIGMVLRFLAGPAAMAVASVAVGLRGSILHLSIIQ